MKFDNLRISEKPPSLDDWNRLLSKAKNPSPFQSHTMYYFYSAIEGFEPKVFCLYNKSELKALITGVLIKERGFKSYFSSRFIIYDTPILFDLDKERTQFFLKQIIAEIKKKVIYIEWRGSIKSEQIKALLIQNKFNYLPYLNIHINLSESLAVKKNIRAEKRRQIRRGLENKATIRQLTKKDDIKELYFILNSHYKKKVRRPLPPWQYFNEFNNRLNNKRDGIVFGVIQNNKIIGGSFCLLFQGKFIYELYRASLNVEFKSSFPGTLAVWAAIDYGIQNEYRVFDFMGAGLRSKKYGVRDFKAEFGGNLFESGRYIYVPKPLIFHFSKLAMTLLYKFNLLTKKTCLAKNEK